MNEVELQDRERRLAERERELEARERVLADELRGLEERERALAEDLRRDEEREKHRHQVDTVVSFPIGGRPPYRHWVDRNTTLGTVLAEAMAHFDVKDDATTTYHLVVHGDQVDAANTVGALAGESHELKLTLAKEITQG